MTNLRLGVVGVGSLGRHHARVAAALPGVRMSGVYDVNGERAREVGEEHRVPVRESLDALLSESDAVVVATPTVTHAAVAGEALARGLHVLVEKPMTATLEEADGLLGLAASKGRVLQVGHIERFNPAVEASLPLLRSPRFIEAHRLSVFTPRSLDVDVILDLMIHDLQIARAIAGRPAVDVRAAGVAVLTPRIDIANARVEFEGGCVANLTASRVSAERVRKFRVFAASHYVSLDLAAQEVSAAGLEAGPDGRPSIVPRVVAVAREEPLVRELAAFVAACGGAPVRVSGEDGREALALALRVRDAVSDHQRRCR